MKRVAIRLLLILAVYGIGSVQAAENSAWILGTWGMSYDPDGSEKDWLEFSATGQVVNISQKGRHVPGEFVVHGNEVRITFHFKGQDLPMTLKYDGERKVLLSYSSRTGNTSEYRREDSPGRR
jgi:hypothetical protein